MVQLVKTGVQSRGKGRCFKNIVCFFLCSDADCSRNNLYEHQSTYNPNMPLRDLFYICSEYQKLVDKKSLYTSTLQKIPAPNFIEFYNGSTALSDCTELRLSSAFENLSGNPRLELIVTVLNVNEGHNITLMQHCSTLKEYALYVAKVRHYAASMPLNKAVEHAADECIKEDILTEFLTQNRAEVINMSIFEYDKELEEVVDISGLSLDEIKKLQADK